MLACLWKQKREKAEAREREKRRAVVRAGWHATETND